MMNINGKGKEAVLPLLLDALVLLFAVAAPIYSAFKGGLSADMLGQLQYFYLIIAALLVLMLLRDVWSALREARKGGKQLLGGAYLPDALSGQMAYRCMFLLLFALIVVFRPKAGALCVLLSGAAFYFILDVRLITMTKKPGVYENGIYFYGTFYPWEKVRSYQVREAFSTVKFNVENEQKKLFYTGDVVIAVEDAEKSANLLAQKVKRGERAESEG